MLVSGSDDGCVGIWDTRTKRAVDYIETEFPITSVAVAEAGNELYTGGIDCDILVYDIRKKAVAYRMPGHTDTVTSLSISPDSQSLLSYSHDGLARTWDIRPFAPVDRSLKTFVGAPVGIEKNLVRASWDSKGERVGVGSGDGSVCIWETRTAKLIYKLPGHRGTVNDMRFAPGEEPISKSFLPFASFNEASMLANPHKSRAQARIEISYLENWEASVSSKPCSQRVRGGYLVLTRRRRCNFILRRCGF